MMRLTALLVVVTSVVSAETLTLEEATSRALVHHPSIAKSKADARAAEARQLQAQGVLLPKLTVNGSLSFCLTFMLALGVLVYFLQNVH